MEAGGRIEERDRVADKRFQVLADFDAPTRGWKKGNWYDAVPPLTRRTRGISLVDAFGRTMVANLPEKIKVGVVKVGVSGTKIELWDKDSFKAYLATADAWKVNIAKEYGGDPYAYLVELEKTAQKDGVIKGILLHQGESTPMTTTGRKRSGGWVIDCPQLKRGLAMRVGVDLAKVRKLAANLFCPATTGMRE